MHAGQNRAVRIHKNSYDNESDQYVRVDTDNDQMTIRSAVIDRYQSSVIMCSIPLFFLRAGLTMQCRVTARTERRN